LGISAGYGNELPGGRSPLPPDPEAPRRQAAELTPMRRLLVITQSNFDPSSRLRLMQYFPGFAKAGWRIEHRVLRPSPYRTFPVTADETRPWKLRAAAMLRRASLFGDALRSRACDAVIVGRELPHLVRFLAWCNPRLVFDFDDAIHLWPGQDAVI